MVLPTNIVDRPLLPVLPRLSPTYQLKTSDPAEAAELVAACLGKSTAAYLDFAEAFAICLKRFPSKDDQIAFLTRLADLGVISRRDAMVLARPNGMISMIKKIGENVHWLRSSEILPLLAPEPSKLYQIVLLYDGLSSDFDLAVSKLKILEPGYTRDEIIALRQGEPPVSGAVLDAQNQPALNHHGVGSPESDPEDKTAGVAGHQPQLEAKSASVVSSPTQGKLQAFDLIAVKCTGRDLRQLRKDFADVNELDRLLPRPVLAARAALVVFARVADIGTVETRLLPHLGFVRLEHVFALNQPVDPDLGNHQVALVSLRGFACTLPRGFLSSDHLPLALTQQLFPQAKSKAQMFATPEEGWTSFGWSEEEA